MSGPALIHYREPAGRNLCGRRAAGGSQGEPGNNHLRERTTCKTCLELLDTPRHRRR